MITGHVIPRIIIDPNDMTSSPTREPTSPSIASTSHLPLQPILFLSIRAGNLSSAFNCYPQSFLVFSSTNTSVLARGIYSVPTGTGHNGRTQEEEKGVADGEEWLGEVVNAVNYLQ